MSTLIIGLGNPGKKYEKTRHNAGFLAVDFAAGFFNAENWKESKKLNSLICHSRESGNLEYPLLNKEGREEVNSPIGASGSRVTARDDKIVFAKPTTFMNESGLAVAALAKYYKIKPQNIIIIYDELDLPFGTIRVRENGSAAGHNGIKSIIQHLGTDEFWRVRIGTKNELATKTPAEKFVLNNFSMTELAKLKKEILPKVWEEIKKIVK
jgi:PTH1 family peptidyl-tRNA hydrolase